MWSYISTNKIFIGILGALLIYIFITDAYRGAFYENGNEAVDVHQIGRSLYIEAFNVDSFYEYSYNDYYITNDGKIVIGFWRKPFFLVGSKQQAIMNIWLNFEKNYKLYYKGKDGRLIYLRDIKYSKEMDDTCQILKK